MENRPAFPLVDELIVACLFLEMYIYIPCKNVFIAKIKPPGMLRTVDQLADPRKSIVCRLL